MTHRRDWELLAEIAGRFITHLFTWPDYAPSTNHNHATLISIALRFASDQALLLCQCLLLLCYSVISRRAFPLLVVPLDTAYLFLPIYGLFQGDVR